jgi:hypothetical protein
MSDSLSRQAACKTLADIGRQITEHAKQATDAAMSALDHARQAGELLIAAKELVGYGGWLAWLQDNCDLSSRQAQRFMAVSRNWKAIIAKYDSKSHLTIEQAIQISGSGDTEKCTDSILDDEDELCSRIRESTTHEQLEILYGRTSPALQDPDWFWFQLQWGWILHNQIEAVILAAGGTIGDDDY